MILSASRQGRIGASTAWQGIWLNWLDALDQEVKRDFGGRVPDAGDWSPADSAFFGRIETYRAAMERHLFRTRASRSGARPRRSAISCAIA